MRLHRGIGYVTPNEEHEGRGEAIRKRRQAGLERAWIALIARLAWHPSTGTLHPPGTPTMLADETRSCDITSDARQKRAAGRPQVDPDRPSPLMDGGLSLGLTGLRVVGVGDVLVDHHPSPPRRRNRRVPRDQLWTRRHLSRRACGWSPYVTAISSRTRTVRSGTSHATAPVADSRPLRRTSRTSARPSYLRWFLVASEMTRCWRWPHPAGDGECWPPSPRPPRPG